MVAIASAPLRKPDTRVTPVAMLPSITERCEIDLSPGTRTEPISRVAGRAIKFSAIVIVVHLVRENTYVFQREFNIERAKSTEKETLRLDTFLC